MEKFLYQRIEKKDPKLNVWFAYGAPESFAMASLGYLAIFKDLDLNPDLYVERIYQDTKITTVPYEDVDCIGFSMSFELDILTIIKMLEKYNFPALYKDRNENHPFVFVGGPVTMSNPLPYEDFFDFIVIGEKIVLNEVFEILKEKRTLSRDEILKKLSEIEGVYVPKYKKEVIIKRDDLSNDIVYTTILSDKSFFKDTFIIELERGCPKMCNFCLASWLNIPTRFVKYEKIIEAIDLGLQHTNKLALLGAYVAGHPDFKKIIEYISKKCEEKDIELSISSLRADLADIDLIQTLVKCKQKTATIALEAGSQRLRNLIGKDLSEQQVLDTVLCAKKGGLKGLKIYAMLGLPTETEEDIEALVSLVQKLKTELKKIPGAFDLTLSASTFIPKAHTPFEYTERTDKKILEKRINYLKKTFHKMGINFRIASVEWDIIQGILSRYNKSLAEFLIEVVKKGGNLGAFKQLWREKAKKGLLPPFEEAAKIPFSNNITALDWSFIKTDGNNLKIARQEKLSALLK